MSHVLMYNYLILFGFYVGSVSMDILFDTTSLICYTTKSGYQRKLTIPPEE